MCGSGSVVEHRLAKARVASSNLVFRSIKMCIRDRDWKNAASNLGVVVSMQTGSYLNREALYHLARTYYLQEDYDQAEKYYLLYLDRFPASCLLYTSRCV